MGRGGGGDECEGRRVDAHRISTSSLPLPSFPFLLAKMDGGWQNKKAGMPQHYVGLIKEPFLPHGQRAKEEWKKGGGRRGGGKEGDEHLRTNK
jgi:hypothetical protein